MKNEIISGLKNALEHGDSLKGAVASFINSGYNPQEVHAAAKILSSGVSNIVYGNADENNQPNLQANVSESGGQIHNINMPAQSAEKVKQLPALTGKKKKNKVIILSVIILLILIIGGGATYLVFKLMGS